MEPNIMLKIEELLPQLDPVIKENPKFKEQIDYCVGKLANILDVQIKVELLAGGKGLRLIGIGRNPNVLPSVINANKMVVAVDFKSDDRALEDALVVDYNQGTAYDAFLATRDSKEVGTVLNTFYEQRVFDKNGIEMDCSEYGDNLNYSDRNYSEVIGINQLFDSFNKPQMGHRVVPRSPRLANDAYIKSIYRESDNLGLAYVTKASGISSNGASINSSKSIESSVVGVLTQYPETLRSNGIPYATYIDGKIVVNESLPETAGKSYGDVCNMLKAYFVEGVEQRKDYPYYDALTRVMSEFGYGPQGAQR